MQMLRGLILILISLAPSLLLAENKNSISEQEAAKKIRQLGGNAFLNLKTKRIKDINLNHNAQATDETMKLVARCREITDLSLENTRVGDDGMAAIEGLPKLEWLNLFQTEITDESAPSLATLPNLQHLPIGGTGITNAGLPKLYTLSKLQYLGLRGTAITDKGLTGIQQLKQLTGLHLGQTGITDQGLPHLAELTELKKLWLHDIPITMAPLEQLLGNLKKLEHLYIQRTHLTIGEVKSLRKNFPQCEIFYEKD